MPAGGGWKTRQSWGSEQVQGFLAGVTTIGRAGGIACKLSSMSLAQLYQFAAKSE